MIPITTIAKFLNKKPVQEGIVAEITKELIQRIFKTQDTIECSFKQGVIYVKNASQELRTTLFLQRTYIINKVEQKVRESFKLYHVIKDIKFM